MGYNGHIPPPNPFREEMVSVSGVFPVPPWPREQLVNVDPPEIKVSIDPAIRCISRMCIHNDGNGHCDNIKWCIIGNGGHCESYEESKIKAGIVKQDDPPQYYSE